MSKNNPLSVPHEDGKALALLTWVDALERLDTILMEARHLQENLVYNLRYGRLNWLLSEEEDYLWGDKFFEFARRMTSSGGIDAQVDTSIPLFPSIKDFGLNLSKEINKHVREFPDLFPNLKRFESEEDRKNYIRIFQCMRSSWLQNKWTSGQRHNYMHLCAIQTLKRNILKDKLYLCYWANWAFQPNKGKLDLDHDFSNYVAMRAVVIYNCKEYIGRLNDHQEHFNKQHDIGLQDHPTPILARRREQSIYNRYLANRCIHGYSEYTDLIAKFGIQDKGKSSSVLHRWAHGRSSHSYSVDNMSREFSPELQNNPEVAHYINTSYWMPERPGLQSVIAHEIAHSVIRDYFHDLHPQAFSQSEDIFSFVLRMFHNTLSEARFGDLRGKTEHYLRELAADLLAISLRGATYLYAQFLEVFGESFSRVHRDGHAFNYNNIRDLIGPHVYFQNDFFWLLRLKVSICWLRHTSHGEDSRLQLRLANGIDYLLKSIIDELQTMPVLTLPLQEWTHVADSLCNLLEGSPRCLAAMQLVKQWREERHKNSWYWNGKRFEPGTNNIPKWATNLSPGVRCLLSRSLFERKIKHLKDRGHAQADRDNVVKHFRTVYGIAPIYASLEEDAGKDGKRDTVFVPDLFNNLKDISWQCSLLRALDLTHSKSRLSTEHFNLLEVLHKDFALGRGFYQLALEFHLDNIEPAAADLSEALRVIRDLIDRYKGDDRITRTPLFEALETWHDPSRAPIPYSRFWGPPRRKENLALFSSVERLVQEYSSTPTTKIRERNETEKIIRRKLTQLFEELDRYAPEELKVGGISLRPLYAFLETRYGNQGDNLPVFHDDMIPYLTKRNDEMGQVIGPHVRVTRISTAKAHRLEGGYGIELKEPLDFSKWRERWKDRLALSTGVIGRYDILAFREFRPLFRPGISRFTVGNGVKEGKDFISGYQMPFFERNESAIAVRFPLPRGEVAADGAPLAFLLISTRKASLRLDLLKRLIDASANAPKNGNKKPVIIEDLHGYFSAKMGDMAFLSDGSSDILLMFRGTPEDRLDDIFTIQDVLYNDFLTKRTELILTPPCYAYASSNDGYRTSIHVRINDRSSLSPSFRDYVEGVSQNLDASFSSGPRWTLTRTPGRMDFCLRFEEDGSTINLNKVIECLCDTNPCLADRIQTDVEKIESPLGN